MTKITYSDSDWKEKEVESIVEVMYTGGFFKWPLCRICEEKHCSYDHFICKDCKDSIDRLVVW